MNNHPNPPDPIHTLALTLLEILNNPITMNISNPHTNEHLNLHGTLLRAFDTPDHTTQPTITIMINAQTTTIRLAPISDITIHRAHNTPHKPIRILINLSDHSTLNLTPSNTI